MGTEDSTRGRIMTVNSAERFHKHPASLAQSRYGNAAELNSIKGRGEKVLLLFSPV